MAITYDVYINDSPLTGHTDLTEAQLLNVWRSLNTSYTTGTSLKVQVMAKDGALTSLNDAVNLTVPVASTTFNETFTQATPTVAEDLDSNKWGVVPVGGAAIVECKSDVYNNKLRQVLQSTTQGTLVGIQTQYKTQFNFASQNSIKFRTYLPSKVNSNVFLQLCPNLPIGSSNAESNIIWLELACMTIAGNKGIDCRLYKKINNTGNYFWNVVLTDTATQIDNQVETEFELILTSDNITLKRDGTTLTTVSSGIGLTFTSGYPIFKSSAGESTAYNIYFDNLYFVNP